MRSQSSLWLTIICFIVSMVCLYALGWSFCFILLICGILSIFFYSRWLQILISALVVFIVSIYIIIDIQLITGKHSHKYSIDDYVMAAMALYIDIIRLFLELLRIFGQR